MLAGDPLASPGVDGLVAGEAPVLVAPIPDVNVDADTVTRLRGPSELLADTQVARVLQVAAGRVHELDNFKAVVRAFSVAAEAGGID